MRGGRCGRAVPVAMAISFASHALAGGFQVPTQSASAGGQGDAFTAKADDASAIYYNPAGLTQNGGDLVSGGVYGVFTGFKFEGSGGEESSSEVGFLPHLYAVTDLGSDRWRIGLGVNTVFGLSEDWGNSGPLRFDITSDNLSVINVAPTVAYQVSSRFSVGGSLNLYHGEIELNNFVPLPGGGEAPLRLTGGGNAVGFTTGALWRFTDHQSLGIVYRSPFNIDFDGQTTVFPPVGPSVGPSNSSVEIPFPQIIVLGYAIRPSDRWIITADLQWADWETLNDVAVTSNDPRIAALPPRQFDYNSTFTYRAGVQYQLSEEWFLRSGFVYSPTSSPDQTFTPTVVDLDSYVVTLGVGYRRNSWGLDLAYRCVYGPERTVNDSVNSPPGNYSDVTHGIVVTLSWRN